MLGIKLGVVLLIVFNLNDGRDLVQSFNCFHLSFVRHSDNAVASYLAKNSSNFPNYIWSEDVLPELDGLVNFDVSASMAP